MRRTAPAIALLCLAGAAAATPAPPPVLEIHNDTSQPVFELYVEPSGDEDAAWEDRLAGGPPISPGLWAELPLDPARGCRYDIEVRTNPGGRRARDVDICKTGRFDISSAGVLVGSPPGGPSPPPPPVIGPPGPLDRGLPICPGDPRCRKKK